MVSVLKIVMNVAFTRRSHDGHHVNSNNIIILLAHSNL